MPVFRHLNPGSGRGSAQKRRERHDVPIQLLLFLRQNLAARLEREEILRSAVDRLRDVDAVRRFARLRARREVDGVAPDVERKLPDPDRASDDGTGVETDADGPCRASGSVRPSTS